MDTIEVPAELLSGVLDYVEATTTLVSKHAEEQAQVAERAPSVVDSLIKAGMLHENQRAAAVEACMDPLKVMDSLEKTASLAASEKQAAAKNTAPASMGGAPTVKNTGVPQGQSKQSQSLSEANDRFLASFGFR